MGFMAWRKREAESAEADLNTMRHKTHSGYRSQYNIHIYYIYIDYRFNVRFNFNSLSHLLPLFSLIGSSALGCPADCKAMRRSEGKRCSFAGKAGEQAASDSSEPSDQIDLVAVVLAAATDLKRPLDLILF